MIVFSFRCVVLVGGDQSPDEGIQAGDQWLYVTATVSGNADAILSLRVELFVIAEGAFNQTESRVCRKRSASVISSSSAPS